MIRPRSFDVLGSGASCGGDDGDVGDGEIWALRNGSCRCCHGCLSGVLSAVLRI